MHQGFLAEAHLPLQIPVAVRRELPLLSYGAAPRHELVSFCLRGKVHYLMQNLAKVEVRGLRLLAIRI